MKIGRIAMTAGLLVGAVELQQAGASTGSGFSIDVDAGTSHTEYQVKGTIPANTFNVGGLGAHAQTTDIDRRMRKWRLVFSAGGRYTYGCSAFLLAFAMRAGYVTGKSTKNFHIDPANAAGAAAGNNTTARAKASPFVVAEVIAGVKTGDIAISAILALKCMKHTGRAADTDMRGWNAAGAGAAITAFDISKKKWKTSPCAGIELRYDFDSCYATVRGVYDFKTKTGFEKSKYSACTITCGFGYKI
jgi:hypothetical protein